jgi:hypothetical protein
MGHNHEEQTMAKKTTKKQAKQTKATQPRPAKRKKIMSLAEYEAEAAAEQQAQTSAPAAEADAVDTAVASVEADTTRRASGLDAAATVLADAGEPLATGEMVKRMLDRGLWTTGGKTPAATIYAAIVREITVKGDQSRFRKTGRGKFELTDSGKQSVAQ